MLKFIVLSSRNSRLFVFSSFISIDMLICVIFMMG